MTRNPLSSSRRAKGLPLTRLLPNMLTVLSLCAGLTAIRFAMMERWQAAVIAIVVAMVFDMLDGRVARMLNFASKFGAELDSLSDAVSFGVAPGLIMYLWDLQSAEDIGWIAVLVFAVCVALRLARFNIMHDDQHTSPVWTKRYFTGMPAPAGAGLALLPLLLYLEYGTAARLPPVVIALWMIVIGGLMVSRLPTFSLKGWRVSHGWVAPLFVATCLIIASLITNPWLTLLCGGITYIVSLPLALIRYRRHENEGTDNDQEG